MNLDDLHGELLARWRVTRHPRIGDLCERIAAARLARTPLPPLAASKRRADLEAWDAVEAEGDPLDFTRLAASARGGAQEHVIAHVRALAKRDDPALAATMLALLEDPPYAGVKSRGLLEVIFDVLRASRDHRAAAPARALGRRYLSIVNSGTGGWASAQLVAIADALDALPPPVLAEADAARCEELEPELGKGEAAAPPAGARTLAQLLDEVYANPADDGARQIYADALLERGEPRGEWIALDLARARGALDAAGEARQRALATPGEIATWAYPLSNGGEVSFERGFPARIRLYRNAKDIAGARELATIHTITGIDAVPQKVAIALFGSPHTAFVTKVGQFPTTSALEKCCASVRPWTSVAFACRAMPSAETFANLPALAELAVVVEPGARLPADAFVIPNLRSLTLRCDCDELVLPPTLERLSARFGRLPARLALAHLPALRELDLAFDLASDLAFDLASGGTTPTLALPPSVTRLALVSVRSQALPVTSVLPALEHVTLTGEVTRAHLAPLVQARSLAITTREALSADALDGFSLTHLDVSAPQLPPRFLATQTALTHLRVWGEAGPGPALAATLTSLIWPHLSTVHLPAPAALEHASLAFPATSFELADFLGRAPRLRTLELDSRHRGKLDPASVEDWAVHVRDSQLAGFTLGFQTPTLAAGRLELARDPDTGRWRVAAGSAGLDDPLARAIIAVVAP